MLVYNTTYQVEIADARNFVIWIHQIYMSEAEKGGLLKNGRLCRILSHKDDDSECFSVQFDVEDSGVLHRWLVSQGEELNLQMLSTFENRVHGFSTMMEIISEL